MACLDAQGYPHDDDLEEIRSYRGLDQEHWFALVEESWNHGYGSFERRGNWFRLATRGWSGNEDVLHAMRGCAVMHTMTWASSVRGGLVKYHLYGAQYGSPGPDPWALEDLPDEFKQPAPSAPTESTE